MRVHACLCICSALSRTLSQLGAWLAAWGEGQCGEGTCASSPSCSSPAIKLDKGTAALAHSQDGLGFSRQKRVGLRLIMD